MLKAIFLALVSLSVGFGIGRFSIKHHPTDLSPILDKLTDIESKTGQLATAKCLVVNTPVLNVDIFGMPNLGLHKVKKLERQKASVVASTESVDTSQAPIIP